MIKKGAVTVSRELDSLLCGVKVGFCITGSFCTFSKAFSAMEALRDAGCDILPVMSFSAGTVDTRFGTAQEHIKRAENICGKRVIMSVADAEPIGPKRLTDIMIVAPCTGNTMAKLARSITDTPVTMAVKSHLRGARPVLIACATNDALAGSLKNIGFLMNCRNYYFVPLGQDDPLKKPCSLVADFSLIPQAAGAALENKQLQPVLI